MSMRVRRAVAAAAALLLCALVASPAVAQDGRPFSEPPLEEEFPGGSGAQATPTATRTATATPTRTPRPTPTPTASPTATPTPKPKPRGGRDDLPQTGSETLRVGLMGLTLLGFGISLRLRVSDARRHH